jgi:hypothetical protein
LRNAQDEHFKFHNPPFLTRKKKQIVQMLRAVFSS